MATVHIVLGRCRNTSVGTLLPIRTSDGIDRDTITSSGASQTADIAANSGAPFGLVWDIKVSGGSVWVKTGTNPTAVAGDGDLLTDGDRLQLGVSDRGERIAVIDA